jgi:hypothetical protein
LCRTWDSFKVFYAEKSLKTLNLNELELKTQLNTAKLLQSHKCLQKNELGHADGESRTPTDCSIRPSSARVYQFHHIGSLSSKYYQ